MLIFDLDGTLIDSLADIRAGVIAALAEIGLEATGQVLALCRLGVGLEQFYECATGGRTAAGGEFERFAAAYRSSYTVRSGPFPGVRETLAELRRLLPGQTFAVATTKRTELARRVLDGCGLAGSFDIIRGSDGLPHKPDPAVLRDIAARAARSLEHAVVVGDTDRDVLAARAAGCTSVAVTYGGWTRDELAQVSPDHMIDRFAELLELEPIARLARQATPR
jgi:phosphoglycolate phosphatase